MNESTIDLISYESMTSMESITAMCRRIAYNAVHEDVELLAS